VQQEDREREKRDKAEQKRIKKMLDDEDRERKRRDAEVAKETERLRKEFGMQGQEYSNKPNLPPRPAQNSRPQLQPPGTWNGVAPPARPVSAGPSQGFNNWFHGSGAGSAGPPPQNYGAPQQPQHNQGRRRGGSADGNKIQKKRSLFF
jgi:hypothetical protein